MPDDGIPETVQLRVNETNDSIRNVENEDPRQSHILEEVETALNLEMTENSEEVCENTYVESMIRTQMDTMYNYPIHHQFNTKFQITSNVQSRYRNWSSPWTDC